MAELADDILHHAALDARMVRVARSIRLLNMVSWAASEQKRFLDSLTGMTDEVRERLTELLEAELMAAVEKRV